MSMDIEDVTRAKQGDNEAFIRLMRQLESQMYAIAKQILQLDEDCADAMQETVMKAYKSVHTLREPAFFQTWVIRILINVCNQILKQRSKQVPFIDVPVPQSKEDHCKGMELQEAIDHLELPMRLVVILHYIQDLPVKKVAQLLDISEGTVKSRLFRAREKLYAWLEYSEEVGISYES